MSPFSAKGTEETIGKFRPSGAFTDSSGLIAAAAFGGLGRLWLADLHTGAEGLMESDQPELCVNLL